MVQKAIDFATKVHEGQYRKGTDRPYIVHPMEVGKIVSTMTQDEEIISVFSKSCGNRITGKRR